MNSKILLIGLIISAIALSGCIQWPPICGNSFCEAGERWGEPNYCPADCPAPSGAVEVTVSDYLGIVEGAIVNLYTADGKLVDTRLSGVRGIALFSGVAPGTYFVTVEKIGYAKFTSDDHDVTEGVTVKIEAKLTPVSVGLATVVVGKGVVRIADGKQYPYDPTDTDTTNDYWTANFDLNTRANTSPAVATVKKITVKNSMMLWTKSGTPKGVWSTDDCLTQQCRDAVAAGGNIAHFLQGESSADPGYDFVKMQFNGFNIDQDLTTVKIGNGKLTYTDTANITRSIPFYIQLANVAYSSFTVDNQTFYYRCSAADVNLSIADGNYLNGAQIDLRYLGGTSVEMLTDTGWVRIDGASKSINFNGVQFTTAGLFLSPLAVNLLADGNCEFSSTPVNDITRSFNDADILQLGGAKNYTDRLDADRWGGNKTFTTKTVYYDDDQSGRTPLVIPLYVTKTGGLMQDTYRYRMYVGGVTGTSDGPVYLVLDNTTNFSNEFSNADVSFIGSDITESGYATVPYYWPDLADFGNSTGDNAFMTGVFGTDVNGSGTDVYTYIDTATGKLVVLPNNQLSQPTSDVNCPGPIGLRWGLNTDTSISSYMQAAWTDYGSKAEITDNKATATFTIPQSQLYLSLALFGGGAELTYNGASYPLKSTENYASVEFRMVLDSGNLPFLANSAKSYRYNGSTYETTVKETLGIEADARFDTDSTVKDLILYMRSVGDFNYVLDLGNGIPCWESTSAPWTKFTDGDSDNVLISLFGEEYTVQEADCVSTTKKVTLVKETAKADYSEGQWINGLEGTGKYAGQKMDIKVGSLVESRAGYSMGFELYDEEGRIVNSLPSVGSGIYLNEVFRDNEGNLALETVVYVDSIVLSLGGETPTSGGGSSGGSTR